MICSDGTNGQAARALGISDECLQHSSGIYGAVAAIERPNQTLVPTPEKRVHNLTFDLSAYGNSSFDEDGKSNFSLKIFGNSKCRFIALAVNKCESKIVKALKTILDKSVSVCNVHFRSFPLTHVRIQKGEQEVRIAPTSEKIQRYRISWQYWSGSPKKITHLPSQN